VTRSEFLAALIGEPWAWQARNCWDFAANMQRELFGRVLPGIAVPDGFSNRWVLEEFARHEERGRWRPGADGASALSRASRRDQNRTLSHDSSPK
jgi:hypothetical protein